MDMIDFASDSDDLVLDTADSPADLPYAGFEDYRAKELLKANGVALTLEALVTVLREGEAVLQGAAAHALGALGLTAAIPELKQLAGTAEDLVKTEAAYALVRLGSTEYRSVLQEALHYRADAYLSPAVAAGDLARLGDPSGFAVIGKCFETDNLIVRMIACKQLTFFVPFHDGKTIDVYAMFTRALADAHADVRRLTERQLRELRTPEARHLLEAK